MQSCDDWEGNCRWERNSKLSGTYKRAYSSLLFNEGFNGGRDLFLLFLLI